MTRLDTLRDRLREATHLLEAQLGRLDRTRAPRERNMMFDQIDRTRDAAQRIANEIARIEKEQS